MTRSPPTQFVEVGSPIFLTNLFDTIQFMSISGHKAQRTFFDYIKLSSEEIANQIIEKVRQV